MQNAEANPTHARQTCRRSHRTGYRVAFAGISYVQRVHDHAQNT
jgi:hypothetical protein